MNKNELVTCIRTSDGRKKWLVPNLANNDQYLKRHGLVRLEPFKEVEVKITSVPVEEVKMESVKSEVKAKKGNHKKITEHKSVDLTEHKSVDLTEHKSADIDPFEL